MRKKEKELLINLQQAGFKGGLSLLRSLMAREAITLTQKNDADDSSENSFDSVSLSSSLDLCQTFKQE